MELVPKQPQTLNQAKHSKKANHISEREKKSAGEDLRNNQTSDKTSTKRKVSDRPGVFEVFNVKSEFLRSDLASLDAKEDDSNKNAFKSKEGDLNHAKKAEKQSGEKDGKDSGKDGLTV